MEYILLIGGLITLIISGEFLVRGAVGIALKFNLPTLVIGMTIVSFGTSAPELLVSLQAAIDGHPDIAIGNVVGSNIANIALVLGLTTLILPITIKRTTAHVDWPIMMGSTVLLFLFMLNGFIERYEGLLFVLILIGFNLYMFIDAKKTNQNEALDIDIEKVKKSNLFLNIILIVGGSAGLVMGAKWLLDGAVFIAKDFGISEHVISVTIIAFGTSVPELITSIVAAVKKHSDISVGNLIGSNIFNILAVLGITSLVKEIPISQQVITVDMYWVSAISLFVFPLMIINYKINRIRGGLLFIAYCTYIYFAVS